ncbi:type II toxin-antitoxin system PrlF family antitoxin [Methylomonas paludis]|uniref:Type II toxin-antitoxin system PrlF family antitoxin n=1 Tax=Methylomonas paludis TaxID=1173101 RepID=A0A975ML23_9GAMM|nr:type II toxin-antitoxin system PrlF family antitoxin [Methylomonas paludis]QWF69796.1 type II toxin-antitoxin system PrlF family antitoxin [Methylomonas paludis]
MPHIHETATVTSKGQITLPKPIRQALGISVGERIAFDLRGTEVIVSKAEESEHVDPAIVAFLSLLEQDIQSGSHLSSLPDDLKLAMLNHQDHSIDLDEEILGDVEL